MDIDELVSKIVNSVNENKNKPKPDTLLLRNVIIDVKDDIIKLLHGNTAFYLNVKDYCVNLYDEDMFTKALIVVQTRDLSKCQGWFKGDVETKTIEQADSILLLSIQFNDNDEIPILFA